MHPTHPIAILLITLLTLNTGCSKSKNLVNPDQPTTAQNPKSTEQSSDACEPGDLKKCQKLCTEKNLESCDRMVKAFEDSLPDREREDELPTKLEYFLGSAYIEPYDDFSTFSPFEKSQHARYEQLTAATLPFLEQACDEKDLANACWLAGIMNFKKSQTIVNQTGDSLTPAEFQQNAAVHQRTFHLITRACQLGNAPSCTVLPTLANSLDKFINTAGQKMSGEPPESNLHQDAMTAMAEICATGNTPVCLLTAQANLNIHIGEDIPKASDALHHACLQGFAEGCFWSALAYASKDEKTCIQLLEKSATADKVDQKAETKIPNEYLFLPAPEFDDGTSEGEIFAQVCETITIGEQDHPKPLSTRLELAKKLANHACSLDGQYLATNACAMAKLINKK